MKHHTLAFTTDQETGFVQHRKPTRRDDLSCEEALYDSASLRSFAGIDLGRECVHDATTLLQFRRLLNAHNHRG